MTDTLPVEIENLGPAMRALSPQRRAFVMAKVYYGLTDAEAAERAGYSLKSHAITGLLAHDEKVQAAIEEQSRKLMKGEGPRSIHVLVAIRDDTEARDADRIKAAVELLNRAGLHPVTEHHEHHHEHLSEAEMDRRILALAAELGLPLDDAKKMLIAPAEFQKNANGVYELAPQPLSDDPKNVAKRATRVRRRGMSAEELAADKERVRAEQAERGRREYQAAQSQAPSPDVAVTPATDQWSDAPREDDPYATEEY